MFSIGQRVAKSPVIGATVYHYDVGGKLIAESDSFGVMQKEYVYLYDQPVAVYGSMNTSQCSATPSEVNGTSFTANNTLERLEGRSGKPGAADWEWGLGYNTQLSGGFSKGEWTWVSGKAYSFTLTYDGQGNGSYQVRDNGVVLLTKTYTGSPGKLLRTGNAIQVWVKANANVGTAKVNLNVNSINGRSLNKPIQTAGNNLYSFDAATFEGQSLTTGFTLNGTVTLTFTGTIPYGSRLNFAVTAGNTTCATQQQKQLGHIYSDHLDAPRLITNGQGQALWQWDSDAFGTTNANENPSNLGNFNFNLRFPGQYYDKETTTHFNLMRDYDPSTGRYIQSDPIGLAGGINTYSYVSANPISKIDPTGEFGFLAALPLLSGGASTFSWASFLGTGALLAATTIPGDTQTKAQTTVQSAALPITEVGNGRWKVLTGCNVNKFGTGCNNCPDRVFGYGYGRDFLEAKKNGETAANSQLKGLSGCQKRHCEPKACWLNGRPVRCPNFN